MIIPRSCYLKRLFDRMNSDQVKVITGFRRYGKSFLLFNIFKQYLFDNGVDESPVFEMVFDRYENIRYRKAENFFLLVDGCCSKGKRYIGTPMKYYFSDMGLRYSRLDFRQIEQTHIMENIVYNELVYRGYRVDIGSVRVSERGEDGKSR